MNKNLKQKLSITKNLKLKKMKRLIITTILVPVYIILSSNIIYPEHLKMSEQQESAYNEMREWRFNYEATILFIKQHEGFAGGKAYYCAAGYKTIGYGHVVKKNEHFNNDRISLADADKLVRKDFNKALEMAEQHTGLKGNKLLAVAHFIFAKGIGNFLKSTLRVKIANNEPVDQEFLKWCSYKKPSGEKVKSAYSLNIRKWEVEMFNK